MNTTRPEPRPSLPGWFLLLPLLAAIAWWPWAPYWKSDDYLMLHHSQHLARALGDFTGPQYASTDIWWFYRPLMTLSFWVDQCLGGTAPLVSHAGNVLVHAASTLLVALLWRRCLGDGRAFLAGAIWALMPGHQGAITWAVGRSDGHGTFWCLLTLLLFLRHRERLAMGQRATVWPQLLTTAAALGTKEIGFMLAPLGTMLAFLRPRGTPLAERVHEALRASAHLWVLFLVYLGWRLFVLGRIGGYDGMQFDPPVMLRGLVHVVADLLVPLRWIGLGAEAPFFGLSRPAVLWLAAVPVLVAVSWHVVRSSRVLPFAATVTLFLVACVPMAPFLAGADNPNNLRYYCLPSVALAGLLAASWRPIGMLVLATWLWPLLAVRQAVHAVDRQARGQHEALVRAADAGAAPPMFVADLPTGNASGTSVLFHYGVDRMLVPPFRASSTPLYPLRPVVPVPPMFQLGALGDEPLALPIGSTWSFQGHQLVRNTRTSALPDLPISGDQNGVVDLASRTLAAMQESRTGTRIDTGIPRTQCYRLTIFTALGYFGCICPEHAPDTATHGAIDLLQFFAGDRATGVPEAQSRIPPAQFAPSTSGYVMTGLQIPVTHDLAPEFPVLIEAGSLQGDQFHASHRARRLLVFRFDRGYPAWVRHALGLDR